MALILAAVQLASNLYNIWTSNTSLLQHLIRYKHIEYNTQFARCRMCLLAGNEVAVNG